MLSNKLSSINRQRVRRKTVLSQLATALGPAWKPDSTSTTTATTATTTQTTTVSESAHRHAQPPPLPFKRLRKSVELFNPSSFPLTRKKRSPSTSAQPQETRRGPGRPRGSRGKGRRGTTSGRTTRQSSARPSHGRGSSTATTTSSTAHPSSQQQQQHRSRQERREDQKLNDAAHASRLHAHGLCLEEFELFQYHIGRSDLENYLKVRNTMLWLWREKPDDPLTLTKAFEETKNFGLHHGLIAHVYEFLLRSGYINFGGCTFQDEETKVNGKQESSHHSPAKSLGHSASRRTIVVIGSGIAGVGAAKQLENLFQYYAWRFAPDLPPKVVVLEARSRVGGRMHSFELKTKPALSSSTPGVNKANLEHGGLNGQSTNTKTERHCVDLGAQIITGFDNGNPMEIIVRRQLKGLKLHYLVEETCDLFLHDGQLVPKSTDVHCEAVFNEILEQACQLRGEDEIPKGLLAYLGDRVKMDSRGPGRVHSTDLPTLGHSMDYFIQSHPEFKSWTSQELGLIHWHYANLEFANATPLDQLSLRHWDQDDDYEFAGHHCMVKEGYGQVPVRLSQGLDVRLDQPVSLIERSSMSVSHSGSDNEPVHIQCRDGSTYNCTAAVVTVPLGVLKSHQIHFSPPLPDWKEQAINNLGFGLLNKLVLVFDKPFWDTSVELFGYVGSGREGSRGKGYNLKAYRSSRGKFYMYWNCVVVSGLPVLVTLMAGQSAYDCESMSKEDLVQEALESLALIHPEIAEIPVPVETIVTRWSQDEFAQGSYSFVGQKGTGDDYDRLSKAVDGQLYFAGEATSRHYPATAHGAYLSGLKVAKEILDSLIGPQAVRSRHTENVNGQMKEKEDESNGTKTENGQGESQDDSSHGSERSHLLSMEDAHTTDTPPPDSKTVRSSLMSLGHGFVVPRRRGRVSRSIVAKFVAERSDDDDSDSDEDDFESDEEEDSESEEEDGEVEDEEVAPRVKRVAKAPVKAPARNPRGAQASQLAKRGRGRPRKYPLAISIASPPATMFSDTVQTTTVSSRSLAAVSRTRTAIGSSSTTTTSKRKRLGTTTTSTTTATTTSSVNRGGVFKRKLSVGSADGETGTGSRKLPPMRPTRAL
ncbi:MAG: flavin-containing amine oxidoreductase-domain containing protein [Linnemannia gamsii]|nr:MAG: flavin-containing amine oxidoreductase-domain containing protein [Linnemannia gamsii]